MPLLFNKHWYVKVTERRHAPMVDTSVVERVNATGVPLSEDEQSFNYFVSRLPEMHNFPESHAGHPPVARQTLALCH